MNNETQLLQAVIGIVKKFEEEIRQNGELFNVYSLLNIEHRENETHSVILADLLSPNGTHGQGRLFLDLFVETITGVKNSFNANVKVKREHSIGKINEDYTEGGRIDILITDEITTWVIENKIYAKDQLNQLLRYRNAFPNAKIFYLKPAKHDSSPNSDIVFLPISYEKEITNWLKKIINNLEHKEYLRNSIKQYYNLVQNIAFTGYTQKMNTELRNAITNSEANIEAAFHIKENYNRSIDELYINELSKIKDHFEEFEIIKSKNDDEYTFYITKSEWKEKNLSIGLEFEYIKEFKDLFIGISKVNENEIVSEEIRNNTIKYVNDFVLATEIWPLSNYLFDKKSMYDFEVAKKLQNGEFKEEIIKELENYAKILDELIK